MFVILILTLFKSLEKGKTIFGLVCMLSLHTVTHQTKFMFIVVNVNMLFCLLYEYLLYAYINFFFRYFDPELSCMFVNHLCQAEACALLIDKSYGINGC